MDFKAVKQYHAPTKAANTERQLVLTMRNMKGKDAGDIKRFAESQAGVLNADVDPVNGRILVTYDQRLTSIFTVKRAFWDHGWLARLSTST